MKSYTGKITSLSDNQIFVFGSNTQGRHGLGAALIASRKFGAVIGQAKGPQGKCYAIVTKDLTSNVITKEYIMAQIEEFYNYALDNLQLDFLVAYGVGKNLNGYTPKEMKDMFFSFPIPDNVIFNDEFLKF